MTTVFGSAIPCRVWGLADHRLLLGRARANEVADHGKPGRDPDTNLQGRAGHGRELRHRLHEGKPGLDGALGVMLVGLRIAEIGKHAVSHVLGDKSTVAVDQLSGAAVISADDAAQVLWVEPGRQSGRAHKVAEHHGELAALGGVLWLGLGYRGGLRRDRDISGKVANRSQYLPPMSKRDADVLEVLIGQMVKNGDINVVLGKALGVLGQAERSEPLRNLLHGGPHPDGFIVA